MSSEILGGAENTLKGNLGGAWDIKHGYADAYTDLGVARRFGGASAAYSLRDIGAMNGSVVRVRREPYDDSDRINDEEKFSANQVQSGVLEDWVNGKLENQLPADEVAVEVVGGSEVAGKYISRVKYSTDPEILAPVFVYYNDSLTVPLKIIRFSTGTSVRWRFERQSDNVAVIDPTNRGTVYESPADVPNSDWVGTGNLAITSITKVSQADAAYSLRKVNSSYSGDAVRIRRSSDEVEVNLAFDSDDKVSASSTITNVSEQGGESGSTTATDLSGFLSETKDVPKSYDHSADPTTSQTVYVNAGKYGASNPSTYDGDSNPDSLPTIPNGSRYATKWTSTNAAYGFSYGKAYNDDTYTVEFDILQKAGTQNVKFQNTNAMESYPQNNLIEGSLSSGSFTTKDQWVHYKMSFRTGATRNGAGLIRSGNTSVQTTWYIANFKITPTTDSDAFVNTWYDQTKDLTQLSNYFNSTLSSSNFNVNAMTEEFGTFFGRDNAVKLTSTSGNTQRFVSKDFGIGAGESVRFTAQIYVPSTNTALDSFAYSEIYTALGFDRKQGVITPAQDQWVDIDFNYVQVDDTFQRLIFWNSASSTPTGNNNSNGDVIYFRNMVVTRVVKGENNAVQDTDVNQPKIAENGALLADGLDFDGSNDEMVLTSALGATTVQSIFAVQKNDITSGGSLLFDNRDANDDGSALFATDSAGNKQASWDAADAEHTATTNEELIGLIKTSSAITIRANGVQKSSTSSSSTIDISTVPKIGQGSFGSSGTNYDGSIKEIICYNSDQSANSFKIESNINNYYGLYNDANEFSTSTWQNGGTGSNDSWDSLTNSSTDGFVASTDNGSGSAENAVCSLNFASVVPDNGRVFVSFNLEFGGTAVSSDSKKVRVQLRDSSGNIANDIVQPADGGDGGTQFRICNQGFNRVAYTVNSSTASNLEFLLEVGNGRTGNMTVTDLRVSRIARNGFVETWYDQSGNGKDATQGTAVSQPTIVQNGGIYKDSNGKPEINFTPTSTVAGDGKFLNFTKINFGGTMSFFSKLFIRTASGGTGGRHFSEEGTASSSTSIIIIKPTEYNFFSGGSNGISSTSTHNIEMVQTFLLKNENKLNIFKNSVANSNNEVTLSNTISDFELGRMGNTAPSGSSSEVDMDVSELILYASDLASDRTDIEQDIKNFYNI